MTPTADAGSSAWERRRIRVSLELECIALELIAEHGVEAVTVEQIAGVAGISARTFFRYFKNVPDVLTAVPAREAERLSRMVLERPRNERLLDAFRSVYRVYAEQDAGTGGDGDDDERLHSRAVELWGQVVASDPDAVHRHGRVTAVLAEGFEPVIRERLDLPCDDDLTAGLVASALSGAVWFAYRHWLASRPTTSVAVALDQSFDRLATLGRVLSDAAPSERSHTRASTPGAARAPRRAVRG